MKKLPILAALFIFNFTAHAAAQQFSALYVFGDSLSDAGQFPDTFGPDGATTRFTNRIGPTYKNNNGESFGSTAPMVLSERLGLGSLTPSTSPVAAAHGTADGDNWAVGGYTTDQILNSITTRSVTVIPPGLSGGGSVLREREGFLPSMGGRADPDALYYLEGGGNDFLLQKINILGPFSIAAQQSRASAVTLAQSARALQAGGAKYIVVSLLPDIGRTPFATTMGQLVPSLPRTLSGLSSEFNAELVNQLRQIDAEIIPLNFPLLVDEIFTNPAAYGLDSSQNLIASCFLGSAQAEYGCVNVNSTWGINSNTPDPDRLFYNDNVHPTTAVHRILADYTLSLLTASSEFSLMPVMALSGLRQHQLVVEEKALYSGDWQEVGDWRNHVSLDGQRNDWNGRDHHPQGDSKVGGVSVGGSLRVNEAFRIGSVLGVYKQDMSLDRTGSEIKLSSYLATAFVQYQIGNLWSDVKIDMGYLDYESKRAFSLGAAQRAEKANTRGSLHAISGNMGYNLFSGGGLSVAPFVSAIVSDVYTDDFSEAGSSSTSLAVNDMTYRSRTLGAGVKSAWVLSNKISLTAEYKREHEINDDNIYVSAQLNSISGVEFRLPGYFPDRNVDQFKFGARYKVLEDVELQANFRYYQGDRRDVSSLNLGASFTW